MTDKTSLPAGAVDEALEPQPTCELLLDTNVVLDLWLFQDPRLQRLREQLVDGRCRWLATEAMLIELGFVRDREFARRYQALPELSSPPCRRVAAPDQAAPWRCRDEDDQKFLDLAWQLRRPLWTRDRDLLSCAKRAARQGVIIETPEAGLHRLP
jgi:predicted nucleic acid-binding protein